MISVSQRFSGLAAALVLGCAHGKGQSPVVSTEPRDYAIQNSTSCFARIHSTHFDGRGEEVLAEILPARRAVVTLAPGLRLFIAAHRHAGTGFYDRQPRRATDYAVVWYEDGCWQSGPVVVRRVEGAVAPERLPKTKSHQ